MSMFGALLPQNADIDLGTESYEEIVDGYCMALEDVETEISGLESLSDAIDNADAFASAIESCGGSVSPALMQFGYAVDPDFGQLIGRECPSDFATENMEEFGSFALESIKTKLVVAWEAVKTFIVKIWEKIKEFVRWVLRLFDRKKQRLEAIVKKAADRKAKGKNEIAKADKKEVKAYDKAKMLTVIADVASAYSTTEGWIVSEGNTGFKIGAGILKALKHAGWQEAVAGGFHDIQKRSTGEAKVTKFDALGFKTCDDISEVAQKIVNLMDKRAEVEKGVKLIEGVKAKADSYKNTMAKFDDPADKDGADKKDADEIRAADKEKAKELICLRKKAILASKLVVAANKEVNNIAASVIQIAGIAGL